METEIICNSAKINPESVVNALKSVFDPDIDFSIYDMGLIYQIKIENNNIFVLMTLTSVTCHEAQALPEMAKQAIEQIYPDSSVEIEMTFEPEWTVDNMSDEIKLKLGLL